MTAFGSALVPRSNRARASVPLWIAGAVLALFLVLPVLTLVVRAAVDGLLPAVAGSGAVIEALALSLGTTAISLLLTVAVGLPLAYLLARRQFRGKWLVDTIVDLPIVLPPAVAGLALLLVFGRRGVLGSVLEPAGIELAFTTAAVVLAQTFVSAPFFVRSARAGITGVDRDLEDAARVDGATPARVLRDVTLPLLGPTIRVSAFFAILGSLQFFDLIWVMTEGGPVNASNTMATYMYTFGFQRFQLGYGAAVSLFIFLICFVFSLTYQRFVMRRDLEGALA